MTRTMRIAGALAAIGTATWLAVAQAGPVDEVGSPAELLGYINVPSSDGTTIGESDVLRLFKGGERACVIAVGDHNPVADMQIIVYDSQDRIVAQDGGRDVGDVVGAVWYPPRTEKYRIVIRNPAQKSSNNPFNRCWVAIK